MKEKMNEKEVKKCPKCGGEMVEGDVGTTSWPLGLMGWFHLRKKGDWLGGSSGRIQAYYCKNCSYIEFYKTPSYIEKTAKNK